MSFAAHRGELLDMLRTRGILRRSDSQPVVSPDGSPGRWMLDSLAVTLTQRGAELAGLCLGELLRRFEGRQLATYGLTGVPILHSCITASGGRYHGLLVRKEAKPYGSLHLIEGPIDPTEPTIVVDDSIHSGHSALEACARLEAAGLRVEGVVCLVRLEWERGCAELQERGYHVEALYDIWSDFIAHMPEEAQPLRNPTKWFPEITWSDRTAPDGLHPAHLARTVLLEYFSTGRLLRPPGRLDADYDSSGGAWVSLRSRSDRSRRAAREGFWHFPGETAWGAAEDVTRAALRTAVRLPPESGKELVEGGSIAVTFFPRLQACSVGQLDNERYGIVVRSDERPWAMGGALPRMPGIFGEWEQYRHARIRNAALKPHEPHTIYRHDVCKAIEPGACWPPEGVPATAELPWQDNPAVCAPLALRALDAVTARIRGVPETTSPLRDDLLPAGVDSIYVSLHLDGQVRGCMGGAVTRLDEKVREFALASLADPRFATEPGEAPARIAVTVSVLYDGLDLGQRSPEQAAACFRKARHALMVQSGERAAVLLPCVAVTHSLDEPGFVAEVIDKAGITRPPYYWRRFECVTWLADGRGAVALDYGFPRAVPEATIDELAALHAGYLVRHQEADGTLLSRYQPFQNLLYRGLAPARLAHAAWTLARAARVLDSEELPEAAGRSIGYLMSALRQRDGNCWVEIDSHTPAVAEVAFLLLALCQLPAADVRREMAPALAATLWTAIDSHGRIAAYPANAGPDDLQDYYPGQVLLALAEAASAGITAFEPQKLQSAFRFYRHRFRYRRDFGQVSWLMQAFSAWWRVTGDPQFAQLVFEIGDWILSYQQEDSGAFINDHQPDTPGYTTACYLEGIAEAAAIAQEDPERRERYLESARRGFRFLDSLIIQSRDASVISNREFAIGGLRTSPTDSEIRTDFVQHSLAAALTLLEERKHAPTGAGTGNCYEDRPALTANCTAM